MIVEMWRRHKIAGLIRAINDVDRYCSLVPGEDEPNELSAKYLDYLQAYRRGLVYALKDELFNMYAWFDEELEDEYGDE